MKSHIIFLAFLIVLLSAAEIPSRVQLYQSRTPISQTFLGSKHIDLRYPYLIDADFGGISNNPLAINLFNSHFFVTMCSDKFTPFNCSNHTDVCVPFLKLPVSADLPNLRLNGYRMLLNVTMGNYGRGNRMKGFVATNCTGVGYDSNDVVGAVGLSLNNSNYLNFDTDGNRFSIHLDNNAGGELIFGQDTSYSDGVEPLRMMGVTKNWEVEIDGLIMIDQVYDFTGYAIFDVNSNYIGVPDSIYNSILSELASRYHFQCTLNEKLPNCTYVGNIDNLPSIVLLASEGNNPITIPPAVYTKKVGDSSYQIFFASLTPTPNSKNQIFVTDSYKNYIVLGSPFMTYFYTVFSYNDPYHPEIALFGPKSNEKRSSGLSAWAILGIVLGAMLIIGLIVGGIYAFKKNKDKRKTESLVAPDTRVGYISYNQ